MAEAMTSGQTWAQCGVQPDWRFDLPSPGFYLPSISARWSSKSLWNSKETHPRQEQEPPARMLSLIAANSALLLAPAPALRTTAPQMQMQAQG
eukprot:3054450-Prymnesium_polylepis.1